MSYLGADELDAPGTLSVCPPPMPLELLLGGAGALPVGMGLFELYALSLWLNSLEGTPACIAVAADLESLLDGTPPTEDFEDSFLSV